MVRVTDEFADWLKRLRDRRAAARVVVLCGGDKSRQEKDIERAKALAQEV